MPDIGQVTDCARAPAVVQAGVRSGAGCRLFEGGQVIGTMDFFTTETVEPSAQRLDALQDLDAARAVVRDGDPAS